MLTQNLQARELGRGGPKLGHLFSSYLPYRALAYTFGICQEVRMKTASIFVNNRTQAVRLPVGMRFPDDVKKVAVRVVGQDRILSPVDAMWDSFFLSEEPMDADFLSTRASQEQPEREAFE